MSVHMVIAAPRVRAINLSDQRECTRADDFVRKSAAGSPFHLPAWNRAVAQGCNQTSHFFIAEADAKIVGVLPLTEVHSPIFGRALVSAGYAVGGGVLSTDPAIADLLVDAAVALARRLSCPTLELKGGALPEGWHHDTGTYVGFARQLASDDDAELLQIPRKQRAEVRKALGFELAISVGRETADRDSHYTTYATSVRNLGTPVFPRTLFEAVLDGFGDDADILTVHHHGKPVASVLSLYHDNIVMPYWGGGTSEARALRANELMYFKLMRHAHARGCQIFDFGRSKVGTGAAAYKKNWGFEPHPLRYAKLALDGKTPRSINPLDPKYSLQIKLWQKLPLTVANRLGPLIARGLG